MNSLAATFLEAGLCLSEGGKFLFECKKPHSDKRGGLNGSLQHLLKVLLLESTGLIWFAGVSSNKTKALFRF